jgi:hypothetical protein
MSRLSELLANPDGATLADVLAAGADAVSGVLNNGSGTAHTAPPPPAPKAALPWGKIVLGIGGAVVGIMVIKYVVKG